MTATPECLGFFQAVGTVSKPGKCTIKLPNLDDAGRKAQIPFDIVEDPFLHIIAGALNHRATTVFDAKPMGDEGSPLYTLKVKSFTSACS